MKLQRKERIGARRRRHYDAPQTPLERVQACPQAHAAKVVALVRQRDRLDPFALAARIDRKLARVYALANYRRGLVPSTTGAAETHAKTARVSAALSLKDLSPSVTPNMARRRAAREHLSYGSTRGPQGPQGPRGPQGPQGPQALRSSTLAKVVVSSYQF